MTDPYYQDDRVTLYHGDCLEITAWLDADVLVTDPPYGIDYQSGRDRDELAASIAGDKDTTSRDTALTAWGARPALVFGTWRIPRPERTHTRLIWDTKGALGMGDLSVPWKPSDQEIYVLGKGFAGRRDSNVLTCPPIQATAKNGRLHPHQKPVDLLWRLIDKCPPGVIGVELDERYCEVIASRLAQGALDFGSTS
ncbi:site-specific DNA-methyltransferase [Speluncibacter jeojiensis]|uniref:Site-specific DNA-methyltransferase n=1 Tax=Speluncibacter jeojiensis TaxID=2710754 RepID=A0A9X4LXT1_9ACTN|nr:site-specific DNA-methyltransferase [Corynebacteriales bacterium D3-21]